MGAHLTTIVIICHYSSLHDFPFMIIKVEMVCYWNEAFVHIHVQPDGLFSIDCLQMRWLGVQSFEQ